MNSSKQLYIVEQNGTPNPIWAGAIIFTGVGFDTIPHLWYEPSDDAVQNTLTEIIAWEPDIIVYWTSLSKDYPFTELEEWPWAKLAAQIKAHPYLSNTKIMVLLTYPDSVNSAYNGNPNFDFAALGPLRVVQHAKTAKELVGEIFRGFEGVNYYLTEVHKSWTLQEYLTNPAKLQDEGQPDAVGEFKEPPYTRTLAYDVQQGYRWQPSSIQAHRSTYLVYILKSPEEWQQGLSLADLTRLSNLAAQASGHQLLIGVNQALFDNMRQSIEKVITQAKKVGGWQVFLLEHMWFEIIRLSYSMFDDIIYHNKESDLAI